MGSDATPEWEAGGKRHLLFVTSSLYFGGAQKVVYLLASGLSDEYDVTVAYCYDSGQRHLFHENCRIRKLPDYGKDAPLWEKARCIGKQIKALRELKKELDIDAAVSLGNLSNYINVMSKGTERVICSERSNPKRSWGRWFYWMTHILFVRSDFVVFQSEKIRNLYGKRIREKSCILKNPLLRPEPALEHREKKIVTLGRLTAQKNHSLLIRSFEPFHKRFPEYSLFIFGDGELEGETKRLIVHLNLSDAVFLEKNDPDVLQRIRDAEMFVLSSNFEGLSNALLECMSMGIACISTRCEGSVDVIRERENGLLVDVGDKRALTEAMCALAQDPELRRRLERQAMEDMKAYDKDTVVKDWSRVIRQCL